MIFLDTDILIDILREFPPAMTWLDSLGKEEISVPGFVVLELLQGCRNKQEQSKVLNTLSQYSIEWPTPSVSNDAVSVFTNIHLKHGTGILDVLIGQMAVSNNLELHSFNEKNYKAIPNLKVVKPYKR